MIFGVADDGYANAEPRCDGALGNGVGGVIGAFGMNIGAKIFEKCFDVGFGEKDDEIHATKSRDQLGTGIFIEDGAAGAFQVANAGIGVDADDEDVAFAASAFEIANVSDVQSVETAVGEDYATAAAFELCEFISQDIACDNFGSGHSHDLGGGSRGLATNGFEKLITRDGGRATFHDHQAAGDVSDVRGFER